MQAAIRRVIGKLQPAQLRHMTKDAAESGYLRHGNPDKREQWLGKALWYSNAATHLVMDAAETYDRLLHNKNQHRLQREQQRPHMSTARETRFHSENDGQVHATTKVFVSAPTSNLSDDEIFDMDNDSDDEAFPTQVLLDMIDNMITEKREKTIA